MQLIHPISEFKTALNFKIQIT